jgi:hypothetical protein
MISFRRALMGVWRFMSANNRSLPNGYTRWPPLGWSDAEARSAGLLVHNLSPVQRAQYAAHGHFDVTGGDTGRHYRIMRGYQMNVEELDSRGQRRRLLCFLPEGRVPVGDTMLAQKIALELFESEALKVAHHTPARDGTLATDEYIGGRYAVTRSRLFTRHSNTEFIVVAISDQNYPAGRPRTG